MLLPVTPVVAWSAEKAPAAVQAEFTAFFARFKAALNANDSAAVAGLAKLPFQNDPAAGTVAQFQETVYKESFSKTTRACLQRGKAIYARDQQNNDTYDIFCDELIFTFTKLPGGFLLTDIGVND